MEKNALAKICFSHILINCKNTSVLVSTVLKVSETLDELDQAEYLFPFFCQIGLCQSKQKNVFLQQYA